VSDRDGRIVRREIVVLAIALFLLSCAKSQKSDAIVFWQFWSMDAITPIVQKFEQENPGVHVRVEQLTWDSGKEKISAAIAARDPPDLCELGSTYMPHFLASGSLSDWSAGVADLRDSLRGWDLVRIGEAVYGLPWELGTRALFYNKTLMARAGLDSTRDPITWDDLYRAAEKIQALGGGVHGYGVAANDRQKLFKKFMPFAWGNGGEILSPDLDSSRFDSPANRQALEFYLRLRKVGLLGVQNDLDKEFKEGRLGLQISGAWLCKQIPAEAPGLSYGVALVPKPAREGGVHASFAGGEVLVSFNTSKNKEHALRLARFLVRSDNAQALAQTALSVQPANVGADTVAFYRQRPDLAVMIRQFETAFSTPNHPAWDAMEAAIEDEIDQALSDRKTAAQAIHDADAKITALIPRK
jgi:multiple sugar transport system substrate-binding protein